MKKSHIFNNPEYRLKILNALSDVGVFIKDFHSGEYSSSGIWKPVSGSLKEKEYLEFIHPEDRDKVEKAFNAVSTGESAVFEETYRFKTEEGDYQWVICHGKTVFDRDTGKPLLFIGADSDITDLKCLELQLKESIRNERNKSRELEILRQVAAAINSSLDIEKTVNIILKEIKRVIPYDAASVQILQNSTLQIIGWEGAGNYDDIMKLRFKYPEEGSLSTRAIDNKKAILSNNVVHDFPAFTQPDDSFIVKSWIGIPLIRSNQVIGLIAVDSFENNQFTSHHLELGETIGVHIAIALENALLHGEAFQLAMEDSLTKLGSRHCLQKEGRVLFEQAVQRGSGISLAMLDIDYFKSVNDDFGHDAGDAVLRNMARIISGQIRKSDLLIRYGGEEFLLIMSDTDSQSCHMLLERIRKTVEAFRHEEIKRHVTISLGYCSGVPGKKKGLPWFQKKADEALYISKREGRNRTTCASSQDS